MFNNMNPFDQILGHDSIKAYLDKALITNQLPNTILFAGPDGVGKKRLALALAHRLLHPRRELSNHPDFHLIAPEGKSGLHSIEAFRKAIEEAHETPFEAPAKCFLIDAADRMQPAAANALLKTLEEPTLDSYFLLVSSQPDAILPTIVSRCAKLTFHTLSNAHLEAILSTHNLPSRFALFARGSAARALELANHPQLEQARQLLFTLLANPPPYPQLTPVLEQIDRLLETEEPLLRHTRISDLFASIALYYRDQELRRIDPTSPHLHFPEQSTGLLPKWEEPLEEARLAFDRNLKLSTCLESFFLRVSHLL
ncbi:MAG: AAA family ATPase [Verrucomicrobiota bacterium]|nr:AAA family ATPase [Verrucomicrobiota bacterium]